MRVFSLEGKLLLGVWGFFLDGCFFFFFVFQERCQVLDKKKNGPFGLLTWDHDISSTSRLAGGRLEEAKQLRLRELQGHQTRGVRCLEVPNYPSLSFFCLHVLKNHEKPSFKTHLLEGLGSF